MKCIIFCLIMCGALLSCSNDSGPTGATGNDGKPGASTSGLTGATGLTGSTGAAGVNGKGCSVTQTNVGAIISCGDGSKALILNGKDGVCKDDDDKH